MSVPSRPKINSEMIVFRCSPAERIALNKLANRRRTGVSKVLRELITQAAAAQRATKSAAGAAAQSTHAPAA